MAADQYREMETQSAIASEEDDDESSLPKSQHWRRTKSEASLKEVTAWYLIYQSLKRTHINLCKMTKDVKNTKMETYKRGVMVSGLQTDLNDVFKKTCCLAPDIVPSLPPGYEQVVEAEVVEGEEYNPSSVRLRVLRMFQALQAYSLGSEFLQKMVVVVGDTNFLGTPGIILPVLPSHRLPLSVTPAENNELFVPTWAGDEHLGDFRRNLNDATSSRGRGRAAHGIAYSWSPLLDDDMPYKERFYILHALSEAERGESVFTTLIGAKFEETSWGLVRWQFRMGTILREFVGVILLFNVGYMLRNELQPELWNIVLTVLLSIITLAKMITEIVMHCKWYASWGRPLAGLSMYFSGWNPLFFMFEIYVFSILLWAAFKTNPGAPCQWSEEETDPAEYCWYREHPIFLCLVVLFRWVYLICCLLCTRAFGQQVYCSFASLVSPPSKWFMLFYVLCVFASFFAYYMFPIEENIKKNALNHTAGIPRDPTALVTNLGNLFNNENVLTFMKIFRLDVMGDFDLWELEGVDPIVKPRDAFFNKSSLHEEDPVVAELDDGERSKTFHRGIQIFFILMATVFNVLFLNVYIGLLGQVYEELFGFRHQIFAEFRSSFTAKELIWKHMISWMSRCGKYETDDDDIKAYVLSFQNREKYGLSYSMIKFNELDEDNTEEKEDEEETVQARTT